MLSNSLDSQCTHAHSLVRHGVQHTQSVELVHRLLPRYMFNRQRTFDEAAIDSVRSLMLVNTLRKSAKPDKQHQNGTKTAPKLKPVCAEFTMESNEKLYQSKASWHKVHKQI